MIFNEAGSVAVCELAWGTETGGHFVGIEEGVLGDQSVIDSLHSTCPDLLYKGRQPPLTFEICSNSYRYHSPSNTLPFPLKDGSLIRHRSMRHLSGRLDAGHSRFHTRQIGAPKWHCRICAYDQSKNTGRGRESRSSGYL